MNLVKMVAIYLLTVLTEGENIRFVFIGSLGLSHPKGRQAVIMQAANLLK